MKLFAATALTGALAVGFLMFDAAGGVTLAQNAAGSNTDSTRANSMSTNPGGASGSAGIGTPNVSSTGPNANAPTAASGAGARNAPNAMTKNGDMSGSSGTSMGMSGGKPTAKSTAQSDTTKSGTTKSSMNSGSAGTSTTAHKAGTSSHHATSQRDTSSDDRATMALNMLSAKGYNDVRDIRQQGNSYVATVMRDGKSQNVTVDPSKGTVSPAS